MSDQIDAPAFSARLATCVAGVLLVCATCAPAMAQTLQFGNIPQLGNAASQLLGNLLGGQGGQPQQVMPQQERPSSVKSLWPSRAAFLQAAQSGQLLTLGNGTDPQSRRQYGISIVRILVNEYQVPTVSADCRRFEDDVYTFLTAIPENEMSKLGNQGPDFLRSGSGSAQAVIRDRVTELDQPSNGDFCDTKVGGGYIAHPYKKALLSLMNDYAAATRSFVDAERATRVAKYQADTASAQAAEQQRNALARADQQQRLDAETARIRADEERRAQIKKSRIGG